MKRVHFRGMHRRRITPEIGRRMAKARWDRYHETNPEREPKMERWYPLEIGFRDKRNGECEFTDLRSVRQAIKLASVMLKFYAMDH